MERCSVDGYRNIAIRRTGAGWCARARLDNVRPGLAKAVSVGCLGGCAKRARRGEQGRLVKRAPRPGDNSVLRYAVPVSHIHDEVRKDPGAIAENP